MEVPNQDSSVEPIQHRSKGQQNKESKWRKLQKKYLQYIQLLKKKIQHAQRKNSVEQSKLTSNSHLPLKQQPNLIVIIHHQTQRTKIRNLLSAFYAIRQFAIHNRQILNLQSNIYVDAVDKRSNNKQIYAFILNLAKTLQSVCVRNIKHPFCEIRDFASPPKPRSYINVLKTVEQKIHNLKSDAFYSILLYRSSRTNSVDYMTSQLNRLKSMLNFDGLIQDQLSVKGDILRIHYENARLRAINTDMDRKLKKLQQDLAKQQEQRCIERLKKEKGLIELGQQLAEKEVTINQLQSELEMYKNSSDPDLVMKTNTIVEVQQLHKQVEQLETQLERQIEISKQATEKRQQLEKDLRNKITSLNSELEKSQQTLFSLGYSQKTCQTQKQRLQSWKTALNNQQAIMNKRLESYISTEATLARIHQLIVLSESHSSQFIGQDQSHKQTLQRISALVEGEMHHHHSHPSRQMHSKTNAQVMTLVEEMIDSKKQLPYNQLLLFGSICEDLFRVQQKIVKIKNAGGFIKQQVLKGNQVGIRQRKWIANPVEPSLWEASGIPDSDPGMNMTSRHNRSNPQLTSRLIELQMEKKKCEELVLQLKQKSMMVRKIVHQFIRTLGLTVKSLSKQTDYALGVLLEVFEYSEDEKEQLFQGKRRGFLGLFERN